MGNDVSEQQFLNNQQNQQIANDPNSLYADAMREEKVTNILQQINPDNLLSDIEHRIRGEKKDVYTNEWKAISEKATPISEDLVANFISFLGAILTQNTSMSNFKPDEVNRLMNLIVEWVADDLDVNAKKYNIEGQFTEYNRIGHIVCISCFAVFKRALNGQESRRIFKILKLTETNSPNKPKGGFMENMKFW